MFNNDLESGKNAERNYWHFIGQVSRNCILTPLRIDKEHIEGKDIQAIRLTENGIQISSTEIKAMLNNHYIIRDNDNLEPSGTIEFELWSNAWDDNGHLKNRRLWTLGWLIGMLHPEEYNEYLSQETSIVTAQAPDELAFMLCKDGEGKKPYACIQFDDFTKLKERLYQIAPFDLDHLISPLHRYDYWANKKLNVPFNTWYVALDKLIDLANITLFEDVPIEVDATRKCPVEIQQARKDFLTQNANYKMNRRTEYERAQRAARSFNKDRGLHDNAPLPNMTAFDPDKLPAWIKQYDISPQKRNNT